MNITLIGRIPSKKNSKKIIQHGGRAFLVPSSNYTKWHKEAIKEVGVQCPGHMLPLQPKLVTLLFYPPDKIRGDLTNKAESVMDLLVDTGVLKDDNWFEIGAINLRLGQVDRVRPRVEVTID